MPQLVSQPFIEYSFTEDELVVAAVLSEMQIMWIETLLAQAASERAASHYEPAAPDAEKRYIFEQEYLRGRMEAFQDILRNSEELKGRQIELRKRVAESQDSDIPHTNDEDYIARLRKAINTY